MSENQKVTALEELVRDIEALDAFDSRMEMLIELASHFESVPERIATRPFSNINRVPGCESEAYIWAEKLPEKRLKFHFAVENPQGISAKALATILDQTLSGLPAQDIAELDEEVVYRIFGKNLSMGKGIGLRNMIAVAKQLAKTIKSDVVSN